MRLEQSNDVAILRMNAGKANAMSAAMLTSLNGLLDELPRSRARAAVLIGYENFFCAGLDLPTLVTLDRPAMNAFMDHFGTTMRRVFDLSIPVVAAINGHAIAGGCVLALMADVRIMATGGSKIGLNEVRLGVGLPSIVLETLRGQLPPASLLPIALEGRVMPADDALRLGLVHEAVAPAELEPRALARAQELAAIPSAAFAQVKAAIRRPASADIERYRASEIELWLDTWFSEAGQALIRAAVTRIKK